MSTDWEEVSVRRGLEGSGGQKAGHEPAVCTCSLEDQMYPGLHQKRSNQQDKGDCPPLLCPHATPLEHYDGCSKSNTSCFIMLAHDIRVSDMAVEVEPS